MATSLADANGLLSKFTNFSTQKSNTVADCNSISLGDISVNIGNKNIGANDNEATNDDRLSSPLANDSNLSSSNSVIINDMPTNPNRSVSLSNCVDEWDFDIWTLATEELLNLTTSVVKKLQLPEQYNFSEETWVNFIRRVENLMSKSNPYHNYVHVVDVMHTCYLFINTMDASKFFSGTDILVLIVSALVHDLDHPGTNNVYHINKKSRLALLYNDISVLENHHCATAFQLFYENKDCNIFEHIDPIQMKEIRKNMIVCILGTDMTYHFTGLTDLKDITRRYMETKDVTRDSTYTIGIQTLTHPSTEFFSSDKDRITLLKTILHTADISNPVKPWVLSKKWSDLITTEFFLQGDLERENGFSISPGMDRYINQQDESSLNFIDFIVAPLYLSLAPLLPKLSVVYGHMKVNRNIWHTMLVDRLKSTSSDAMQCAAIIDKWENKRIVFEEQMGPYCDAANDILFKIDFGTMFGNDQSAFACRTIQFLKITGGLLGELVDIGMDVSVNAIIILTSMLFKLLYTKFYCAMRGVYS
eukprot:gene8178-16810_t